jgi:YggT family protein
MGFLTGFLYVICTAIQLFIDLLWFALLLRAILSWFVTNEDAWYIRLLDALCEPTLFPIRALFAKFGWFENLPVDVSPLFAMLLLSLISGFLPAIPY